MFTRPGPLDWHAVITKTVIVNSMYYLSTCPQCGDGGGSLTIPAMFSVKSHEATMTYFHEHEATRQGNERGDIL